MPNHPPNNAHPGVARDDLDASTSTLATADAHRHPSDPYFIPQRIGPYRVISELGRGGMGSVLLALRDDDTVNRRVAIKLVKRGLDTQDILKRFHVERQVLGALSHPNIARVLDAGASDDGRPYFVMEYVEGRPIDAYCDQHHLDTVERLRLFRKVCAAVQYAHQNLIVHRDIKPGNILVTADGEPKLLDFGIAKLLNADLLNVSLVTLPELRMMTPEYASPEQARGDAITTASDIYSLGVLLYELLTGHRPYKFKSRLQDEIVRVICDIEPEAPSTAVTHAAELVTSDGATSTITADEIARRREGQVATLKRRLAGDIDNIVLMAMRKSPRRRYESAEQLSRDIENQLAGRPVVATKETWTYLAAKFARRHRAAVAGAAAIVVVLLGGIAATTWQAARARAAERRAIDSERRAVHRYEQTRELARTYLNDFHDRIARLEGATPARRLLVDTSVGVLERLAAQAGDDPELRRILATGYRKLADVQGAVRGGGEGSLKDALPNYARAVEILRSLILSLPAERGEVAESARPVRGVQQTSPAGIDELRLELAQTLVRQADALERTGSATGALANFAEAESITRAVIAGSPADAGARRLLTLVLIALGDRDLQREQLPDAARRYKESVALLARLCDEDPGSAELKRELAVGYVKLGRLAAAQRDLPESLSQYQRALTLREALLVGAPDNATAKRDVVQALTSIAETHLGMRAYDLAAAAIDRRNGLADALARADSSDTRAAQDVARGHELRADLARLTDDPDAAADHYGRALTLLRSLVEADRADSQRAFALAQALEKAGLNLTRLNDAPGAVVHYTEAVTLYERLAFENPDKPAFDQFLKRAKGALAAIQPPP